MRKSRAKDEKTYILTSIPVTFFGFDKEVRMVLLYT